ncbi:hypothetical protein CC78DRAFT_64024 [Lojkania enalia]|uniref:C2H2-type domain-containing protein n=1 Tax=Lojkania enalia TaxID=147567 RepID=A0A9P4KFA6_9PLEO|nr:hypothetical protein CC78DRAFT_64024 [Didymosphaeria enalia]
MTLRSPKQQPKTITISRRLRNRADQDLSVQPPELHQLRGLRSRRAATSSTTRRISVNYDPQQTHTPVWNPTEILDPFPRSNTTHPSGLEDNPPSSLLSQPLDLSPYHSPQRSPIELLDQVNQPDPNHFKVPPSSNSDLLPSPLSSLSGCNTATNFSLVLSPEPEHTQDPSVELQDMSTLGFMMPAQYPLDHYGSPPALDSPSYQPLNQHPYSESRTSQQQSQSSGAYAPTYTSSPSLQNQSQPRRSGEHTVLPPYQQPSSVPRSPYQQPLGSLRASPTPMSYPSTTSEPSSMLTSAPHTYPYPAIQTNLPGQGIAALGSNSSSYPSQPIYPPGYDVNGYNPLPATLYPPSTTAASYPAYDAAPTGLSSSPGSQANGVRVLNSRPKPQCWEHGCNGRQFSTFSNLLRHQREKSGTAAKSYCPKCGAEFTRTTARNGHMAHDKCKPRRTSDTSR